MENRNNISYLRQKNNIRKGLINLSEQYFLEKTIQSAEDAKGAYMEMAHLNLDPATKQMYSDMVTSVTSHLSSLNKRLKYLKQQDK